MLAALRWPISIRRSPRVLLNKKRILATPVLRTVLLKVWNPSRRTRATIHRALRAYTNSATTVLAAAARDWAAVRIEGMHGEQLTVLQLASVLSRRYRQRTMPYPLHSSLRDALFADIAATLISYDALCQSWLTARDRLLERIAAEGWSIDPLQPLDSRVETALTNLGQLPSWPRVPRTRPDIAGYDRALAHLAEINVDSSHAGTEEISTGTYTPTVRERRLRQLLTVVPGPDTLPHATQANRLTSFIATGTIPLSFPRADGAERRRNFSLLYADRHCRYSALVYLLPGDDPRRRPLQLPDDSGNITVVHPRQSTVAGAGHRPSGALRLDLACGAWHVTTTLAPALAQPEMVRTARLIYRPGQRIGNRRRDEAYFLALTVAHQTPVEKLTRTYLGVVQTEDGIVGWAIVDPVDGKAIAVGKFDDLSGLREQWREDRRLQARAGRIPPRAHHIEAAQAKAATHRIANHLVDLADEHTAQVGVVDTTYLRRQLSVLPRERSGAQVARSPAYREEMAERNYRRMTLLSSSLAFMLSYKLPRRGLPRPLTIRGISPRECANCGVRGVQESRCTICGTLFDATNTALVAARDIAPRLVKIRKARAARLAL